MVIVPIREVDHEIRQHLATAQTNAVVSMGGELGQDIDGNAALGVVKSCNQKNLGDVYIRRKQFVCAHEGI